MFRDLAVFSIWPQLTELLKKAGRDLRRGENCQEGNHPFWPQLAYSNKIDRCSCEHSDPTRNTRKERCEKGRQDEQERNDLRKWFGWRNSIRMYPDLYDNNSVNTQSVCTQTCKTIILWTRLTDKVSDGKVKAKTLCSLNWLLISTHLWLARCPTSLFRILHIAYKYFNLF